MKQNINKLELAWAAGIMDADGSITILNSSERKLKNGNRVRYPELRLWLSNYDIKMVAKFKELFGGTYYVVNRRDRRKPIQTWCVACNMAEKALVLLEPYLVTKKEQARLALRFQKEKESRLDIYPRHEEWEERCKYWISEAKKLKV